MGRTALRECGHQRPQPNLIAGSMIKSRSSRIPPKRKVVRPASGSKVVGRRSRTMDRTKWVYNFGNGTAEGRADMKDLLGGKGAGLAEMSNLGLPVPPGFTITTEVCTYFFAHGKSYPAELRQEVERGLAAIEHSLGTRFGDADNPLLVSVRSGARVSMPGMMDTVLNLGLNDQTVEGLAKASKNPRFAYDSYRRFIMMYSDVVLGVHKDHFEREIEKLKARTGKKLDTDISADEWRELTGIFKAIVQKELGKPFPQDPIEQLFGGICAVFDSWETERAV